MTVDLVTKDLASGLDKNYRTDLVNNFQKIKDKLEFFDLQLDDKHFLHKVDLENRLDNIESEIKQVQRNVDKAQSTADIAVKQANLNAKNIKQIVTLLQKFDTPIIWENDDIVEMKEDD